MQRLIQCILKTLFSTLAVHSVKCAPIAHIPKWIYSHGYQISVSEFESDFFYFLFFFFYLFFLKSPNCPHEAWKANELISQQQLEQVFFQHSNSQQEFLRYNPLLSMIAVLLPSFVGLFHLKKNVGVTLWQMSILKFTSWITSWAKSVDP